jgi:hypothetical protein
MAILIKADGTVEEIKIPKQDQLKFLQDTVGGYIQMVSIPKHKGHTGMIINEEGKLMSLPHNAKATMLYNNPYDSIVGNAILFKNKEID